MSASDIAAWWGAAIATLVLAWDIFKWKLAGPRLRLAVSSGMAPHGNVPNVNPGSTYILLEVVNVGEMKTELTHVIGFTFKTRLHRMLKKNEGAFVVVNPALTSIFPCVLNPGDRWVGGIEQTKELEAKCKYSLLYCGIYHSSDTRPITKRVTFRR